MSQEDSNPRWSAWWVALWLPVLLVLVALRFAEPVGDGDLFWQMAYGQYMLEHKTLIPDHTIYSWTDATNTTIYCSWFAEILLYLMHKVGGLELLFAFRYAVVVAALALGWHFAARVGLKARPELFVSLVVFALASYVGTILKPELFSFGFFALWGYLSFRFRLAAHQGQPYGRYLWSLPLVMVLWTNSHGVFVFGVLGLCVMLGGELFNLLFSRGLALPKKALGDFALVTGVCILAMAVNPYHINYLWQLIKEPLDMLLKTQDQGSKTGYASLAAHLNIWRAPAFHFVDYMYFYVHCGLTLMAYQFLRSRSGFRVDWVFLFLNLVFLLLYNWYLRTTFYWPIYFLYSSLFLLYLIRRHEDEHQQVPVAPASLVWGILTLSLLVSLALTIVLAMKLKNYWFLLGWATFAAAQLRLLLPLAAGDGLPPSILQPRVGVVLGAMVLGLYFAGRGSWESIYRPYSASWCGFGITYWNPVDEAEFLKKYHPGLKAVINDYDSGGYLIWALYPQGTKIMLDPRNFPFRHFFTDYMEFERGRVGLEFLDRFGKELPEVAVVSLKNVQLWRTFLESKDWVPGWMGTAYVVFVKQGTVYPPEAAEFMPDRFKKIRNLQKAMQIFQFGIESQLLHYSWDILEVMKANFHTAEDRKVIENLEAYKEFTLALNANKLPEAIAAQERCCELGNFYNLGVLKSLYEIQLKQWIQQGKGASDPEVKAMAAKLRLVMQGINPIQPRR